MEFRSTFCVTAKFQLSIWDRRREIMSYQIVLVVWIIVNWLFVHFFGQFFRLFQCGTEKVFILCSQQGKTFNFLCFYFSKSSSTLSEQHKMKNQFHYENKPNKFVFLKSKMCVAIKLHCIHERRSKCCYLFALVFFFFLQTHLFSEIVKHELL